MILRLAFFILMAVGLLGFGTVAWISTRPPPLAAVAANTPPPPVTEDGTDRGARGARRLPAQA